MNFLTIMWLLLAFSYSHSFFNALYGRVFPSQLLGNEKPAPTYYIIGKLILCVLSVYLAVKSMSW